MKKKRFGVTAVALLMAATAAFAREKYTNYSYKMTEKDTRGTGAEAKTEDTVIEYKLEEKKAFYAVQTSKDEEAADGNTQRKTERYETYSPKKTTHFPHA